MIKLNVTRECKIVKVVHSQDVKLPKFLLWKYLHLISISST